MYCRDPPITTHNRSFVWSKLPNESLREPLQTSKTIYISQFSSDNNNDDNELLEKMGIELDSNKEETLKYPELKKGLVKKKM